MDKFDRQQPNHIESMVIDYPACSLLLLNFSAEIKFIKPIERQKTGNITTKYF